jgi:hypothetical protein
MIISMLPAMHPKRILWLFFDEIFEEIFNNPGYGNLFIKWKFEDQKQVVDQMVKEIIEKEREMFEPPLPTFREFNDNGE